MYLTWTKGIRAFCAPLSRPLPAPSLSLDRIPACQRGLFDKDRQGKQLSPRNQFRRLLSPGASSIF